MIREQGAILGAGLTSSYLELANWLINAFNGEWLKVANAKPVDTKKKRRRSEEVREMLDRMV